MYALAEQITKAYEEEQQQVIKTPTAATDLPLSYEAITTQWLTNVLCAACPNAEVVAFKLGEADSGSANRRKIKIEYNQAGIDAGLEQFVFCKATHDLPNRIVLGTCGGLNSEVTFYKSLREQLAIEAPECLFARYDSHTFNSMIILGDLTDHVESFCDHKTPMNLARAKSQMDLLAELHSRFYQKTDTQPEFASLGTFKQYFESCLLFGLEEGCNKGFLEAKNVIPENVYKQYEAIWPATVASVERHTNLPKTFIHSDVHLKNWYVKSGDHMGLSDWQCLNVGHWSRDLAYCISTALTVEDRRKWEKDLIKYYLSKLAESGIADTCFEDAWNLYCEQLLNALAWWTITLAPTEEMMDMQPRDITLEFIRRISTAIDDNDSLSRFD